MSNRMLAIVALGAMLTGASAGATTIEIPLPGLLGVYPLDESNVTRTTTFVLPEIPAAINGVSFRIAGTTEVGELLCEGGVTSAWPMDFQAYMEDPAISRLWSAWSPMPEVSGPFGWTTAFTTSPPNTTTDWAFLLDGEHEITLWGAPAPLGGFCSVISSPTAIVTEAVLIIDTESPVPVESSTWGRVKALFRAHP